MVYFPWGGSVSGKGSEKRVKFGRKGKDTSHPVEVEQRKGGGGLGVSSGKNAAGVIGDFLKEKADWAGDGRKIKFVGSPGTFNLSN